MMVVVGPVAVNGKSANVRVPPTIVLTKVRVAVAALVAVQAGMPLVPVSCPPFCPAQTQVTVALLVDVKVCADGRVPAEHSCAPVKVSGPPGYGYTAWLTGAFMEAVPQAPSIDATALVAVQMELGAPPFEPPHVQVVVPPEAGKPEPKVYVTTPLPRPHIVPEKAKSV